MAWSTLTLSTKCSVADNLLKNIYLYPSQGSNWSLSLLDGAQSCLAHSPVVESKWVEAGSCGQPASEDMKDVITFLCTYVHVHQAIENK